MHLPRLTLTLHVGGEYVFLICDKNMENATRKGKKIERKRMSVEGYVIENESTTVKGIQKGVTLRQKGLDE
jgi:hypothetical protein